MDTVGYIRITIQRLEIRSVITSDFRKLFQLIEKGPKFMCPAQLPKKKVDEKNTTVMNKQ